MDNSKYVYVASCVFTEGYPQLSMRIVEYLQKRFFMQTMRCCVVNYKVQEFEDRMASEVQPRWKAIPHYFELGPQNTMVYVCHNCSAIFQEMHPKVNRLSLWELIASDPEFPFPNYSGERMTIQDCWRSYDNRPEQEAARALLKKMNVEIVELADNYEKTQFCGISLLQPAPKRNLILAPERFVKNAPGKFLPHSEEEKQTLMSEHCRQIPTEKVVAYCHYCIKGLKLGRKTAVHLAELLFPLGDIK